MCKKTKTEQTEIEEIIREADEIYDLMENKGLGEKWKHDSERFMAFTAGHTRHLVKHSITLSRQTCWLMVLTTVLGVLTIAQIFIILNTTYSWF